MSSCVSDGDFVDLEKVDGVFANFYSKSNYSDIDKKRELLESSFLAEPGPWSRWTSGSMLDAMDTIFKAKFMVGGKVMAGYLDNDDLLFQERLVEYMKEIERCCLEENTRRHTFGNDFCKTFPSRVRMNLHLTCGLPIPTASVLPVFDAIFKKIPLVFDEVSSTT
jgi:hypothetical protein